ncbi:MAG: toprim domain-containing protein [Myxococcales bacterium]|nr:toprim domain-containing protein [Myxococcales bacterium]
MATSTSKPTPDTTGPAAPLLRPDQPDADALAAVIAFYHQTLLDNPEAIAKLGKQGIDTATFERHQIGLSDRTLGQELPERNRQAGAAIRAQLQRLGVLRASGHEHFRGCITIPVFAPQGQVLEVYGLPLGRRGGPLLKLGQTVEPDSPVAGKNLAELLEFIEDEVQPTTTSTAAAETDADTTTDPDEVVLRRVVDFYRRALPSSPEALAFLDRLGLGNQELIDCFKLGYADRSLGRRLPPRTSAEGTALRDQLTRLGVFRERGHEHFHGAITVPLLDAHGAVVQLYGRRLDPHLDRPQHLWLPGPMGGVLNRDGLGHETIVTGSVIDALTLWVHGFRDVTACIGADGVTDDHVAVFEAAEIERVIIAMPRGNESHAITEAITEMLDRPGRSFFEVLLPPGLDVNAYARQADDPREALSAVIRGARWLSGTSPNQVQVQRAAASDAASGTTSTARPATTTIDAEVADHEVTFRFDDRRWRVRGLEKNLSYDRLKLNILVSHEGDEEGRFHVDVLDLYSARHRHQYIRQAAIELGVNDDAIKHDLGRVLRKLEELQDEQIQAALKPVVQEVEVSPEDREAALGLLKDPNLLDRILADFERCGVVGERTNKLVGYLAATSRKLDAPLAVLIQSSSAAGKSSLMEAVLAFMPGEDRVSFSAMTGQSLFYMGDTDLRHKTLSIAEEEGASTASYALKLLQSEGSLSISSTGKDPMTGRLTSQQYRVEGPVQLMLTTTSIELDPELANRCLVVAVDEGREQTRAIHARQRIGQTLDGLLVNQERTRIRTLHQNAQRLLRPLHVVNPFAPELSFADHQTRSRRDHAKYLTLIRAVTLLHQHQRQVKVVERDEQPLHYIEVTKADLAIANMLAHEVLGRSLDDLPPQTRKLLALLHEMVTAECSRLEVAREEFHFTRRQVRDALGWGDTQLKVHLRRLVDMEYLTIRRENRRYLYELLYAGQSLDGAPFVNGLIEPGQDAQRSGLEEERSALGRPSVGPRSGGGRGDESSATPRNLKAKSASGSKSPENARRRDSKSAEGTGTRTGGR